MRRNPFIDPRIPPATSNSDIEYWTHVSQEAFAPFVRRRKVLVEQRHLFRTELINLIPILNDTRAATALWEAVRLCRRSIYSSSDEAHGYQIALIPDTIQADGRWLSIVASTPLLDTDADLGDRAAQFMTLLDSMIEGCLKPRVRFLFGFAHHLARGSFPTHEMMLGGYIAQWPSNLAIELQALMDDPLFGVRISQWRNIASHRDYHRVGADLFEATYGEKREKSVRFSFGQLETIVAWASQVLRVCRMAQVIIDLEFMPELKRLGLPQVSMRIDGFLLVLSHNLRMVGFTYVAEEQEDDTYTVLYRDDLARNPRDAIIHLSQGLDELAIGTSSDLALKDRIRTVRVGLVTAEERIYAIASVPLRVPMQWLNRKLSMEQYVDHIDFWLTPVEDQIAQFET